MGDDLPTEEELDRLQWTTVLYYLHERAWYYLAYQEDHAQTLEEFRD